MGTSHVIGGELNVNLQTLMLIITLIFNSIIMAVLMLIAASAATPAAHGLQRLIKILILELITSILDPVSRVGLKYVLIQLPSMILKPLINVRRRCGGGWSIGWTWSGFGWRRRWPG